MGEHNYFFLDDFEWEVLKLYIKYGYGSAKLYSTSFFNCLTDETALMTLEEYADRAVDVNGVRWIERAEGREGMKCLTCKKHYSQSGRCREDKKNCIYYEEEPRGKMVRTTFSFKLDSSAETPVIRYGSKVVFEDNHCELEVTIIKINWINLETMMCNVDAEYHENETPRFEKVRQFKIIRK